MTTSITTGLRCTGLFLAGLASTSAARAGDTEISFIVRPPAVIAAALGSGDATFNRLRQNCSTLSGSGTSVHYDSVQFSNPTSAAMTLDVRTQAPGGNGTGTCDVARDTVMMAYSGSFNPAAPTQQCIGFNDDATSPNLDRCSRISGLVVAPQSTVVIVVAAFDNGQSFDYDLRFDGTAPTQAADALFRTGFEDGEGTLQPEASRSVSGQITIDGVVAPVAADSTMDRLLAPDGQYFGFLQLAPITLSGMSDLGPDPDPLPVVRRQWWLRHGAGERRGDLELFRHTIASAVGAAERQPGAHRRRVPLRPGQLVVHRAKQWRHH
jgi:hypothetical protein